MENVTRYMALMAVCLIALAGFKGGIPLVAQGFKISGMTLLQILPLLLLAFGVTGLLQGVLKKETIQRWLGREAGFKGIMLGGLAGAIIPGGPYVFYPVIVAFLRGGADMGSIIAFLAAKNLWTVSRIPLEIALVGWKIFISRFIVTLVFPPIMGILANIFFPNTADNVRDWIDQHQRSVKGGPV